MKKTTKKPAAKPSKKAAAKPGKPAKAKASTKAAKASTPAHPLIASGRGFLFTMADFDANDTYRFIIDAVDDGLTVRYEGVDGGALSFSDKALDGARSFIVLSQGGTTGSDGEPLPKRVTRDLPPFLLSRKVLAELKKGPSKIRPEWAEDAIEVEVVAAGSAVLGAGKTRRELPALKVEGNGIAMWVLDDERWPVIVSRDEGDNYWRLLANGADVALGGAHEAGEIIANERPHRTGKPVAPLADAGIVKALLGNGSAKLRVEAAKRAAKLHSPEVTSALFVAAADPNWDVSSAAKEALQEHATASEFVDALCAQLADVARRTTARSDRDKPTDHERLADTALDLVAEDHLRHAPLADLMRDIARSHPNHSLRDTARRLLINKLEDAVMRDELIALIDAGTKLDLEHAKHAVDAAIGRLPVPEARRRIEKLVAAMPHEEREGLWSSVLGELHLTPDWIPVALEWWRAAPDVVRKDFARSLRNVKATTWGEVFDVNVPAQLDQLLAVYREAENMHLCDEIEEVLAEATAPLAVRRVVGLLEEDRSYARGSCEFVLPLLDKIDAKTLAPILEEVIPRVTDDNFVWDPLVEALTDRAEAPWKPVRTALANLIEVYDAGMNVPHYREMITALRSA